MTGNAQLSVRRLVPGVRGHRITSVPYRYGTQHRYTCSCGLLLGMTLLSSSALMRGHRLDLQGFTVVPAYCWKCPTRGPRRWVCYGETEAEAAGLLGVHVREHHR